MMNKKQMFFIVGLVILGIVLWGTIEALLRDVDIWKGILAVALAIVLTGLLLGGGLVVLIGIFYVYNKLSTKEEMK